MTSKSVVATAAALTAAAGVSVAQASDWPDSHLDAASSQVAGHPTTVWCENSWLPWESFFASQGEDGTYVEGFTYGPSDPRVFVNPRQCETLHALLAGEDVGTYYASSALLTLVHESVHQRGITDEGVTDCTAIPLVPGIATEFFGVPQDVTVTYVKRVRRRKHWTLAIKHRSEPNPWLTQLAVDVERWHKSKPAQYQGNC